MLWQRLNIGNNPLKKYLAKYYAKKNLKINCVSPGGIEDNLPKTDLRILLAPGSATMQILIIKNGGAMQCIKDNIKKLIYK